MGNQSDDLHFQVYGTVRIPSIRLPFNYHLESLLSILSTFAITWERLFLVRSTDPGRMPLPEGIETIFSSNQQYLIEPDQAVLECSLAYLVSQDSHH